MPFVLHLPFLEGGREGKIEGIVPHKIASPSRVHLPNSQRAYV